MKKISIVATPIGNLEDISLRAVRVLKEADVIACEDTRVTSKLLRFLNIPGKKLVSYHNFNEKKCAKTLVNWAKKGVKVAQVSDAGTPVISDPGYALVSEAIKTETEIEFIPGASSLIMAFVLSNFSYPFTFLGFLKPKKTQRLKQLESLSPGTYVAFVSPHRIFQELEDIAQILEVNSEVFLAKELTKKFEKHYRGSVTKVTNELRKTSTKGEFCVVFSNKRKNPKIRKTNKYAK